MLHSGPLPKSIYSQAFSENWFGHKSKKHPPRPEREAHLPDMDFIMKFSTASLALLTAAIPASAVPYANTTSSSLSLMLAILLCF